MIMHDQDFIFLCVARSFDFNASYITVRSDSFGDVIFIHLIQNIKLSTNDETRMVARCRFPVVGAPCTGNVMCLQLLRPDL